MKTLDVIVAVLLVVGGLSWGLVGLFDLDVVAAIGGEGSVATRAIHSVVGAAALYQVLGLRSIQRRWNVEPSVA